MLPFLKNQQEASVSTSQDSIKRKPDEESEGIDSLEVAMEELFNAKSNVDRAMAFRAAFELLEMKPHEEDNHG